MDKKETDLLFSSLLNFAGSDTPNDAEHVTATGLSLYVIKKYLLEGKDPREFLEGIADQTGQEAETMDGSAKDAARLLAANVSQMYKMRDKMDEIAEGVNKLSDEDAAACCERFLAAFQDAEPEPSAPVSAAEWVRQQQAAMSDFLGRLDEYTKGDAPGVKRAATLLGGTIQHFQNVGDNIAPSTYAMSNAAANDAFLYGALGEHPEQAATVADVCKGVITRVSRAAAFNVSGRIWVIAQMTPKKIKANRKIATCLQSMMKGAYQPEIMLQTVLDALPRTLAYMREHEPKRAAELEAYARNEIQAAFLLIRKYVDTFGENPLGEKSAPAILQTLPIMKRVDGTDKLTQAVFGGHVSTDVLQVAMEPAGSPKEVTSAICLLNYEGFTLPNGQPLVLNPFLYEVYNAVCSIRAAGNRYTTYNMIYKVMTGKTGRGKSKAVNLKPEKKEEIRKALQILRVGVSVDIHEEVDAGYIKDENLKGTRFERLKDKKKRPAYLDDVLLDTRVIGNVNIDGRVMDECIEIKDEPILYTYSKARNQISKYPLEVLDAPIRNSADNMAVRGILIRWILMGDKKKDFYKLAYDTIFEAVGIDPADKSSGTNKRRTQIRKTIDECLMYWKKIDFIRSYTVNRRGAKYISITVTTPEQVEQRKQLKRH